jgi:hypothetical protein
VVVYGEFWLLRGSLRFAGLFLLGLGAENEIFWLQKRGQNVVIRVVAGVLLLVVFGRALV